MGALPLAPIYFCLVPGGGILSPARGVCTGLVEIDLQGSPIVGGGTGEDPSTAKLAADEELRIVKKIKFSEGKREPPATWVFLYL